MSGTIKVRKASTIFKCDCGISVNYTWNPSRTYTCWDNVIKGYVRKKLRVTTDEGWFVRLSSKQYQVAKYCLQCGQELPAGML